MSNFEKLKFFFHLKMLLCLWYNKVLLKMDSSVVIITDLVIGGNTFNYYIRFIVKNNKGVISEVSPVELENL